MDCTASPDVENLKSLRLERPARDSEPSPCSSSCAPARVEHKPPRRVRHRYHYRAVREEVATPVWQIDNLEHALIAYRDSLKGQLMLIFTGSVFN